MCDDRPLKAVKAVVPRTKSGRAKRKTVKRQKAFKVSRLNRVFARLLSTVQLSRTSRLSARPAILKRHTFAESGGSQTSKGA